MTSYYICEEHIITDICMYILGSISVTIKTVQNGIVLRSSKTIQWVVGFPAAFVWSMKEVLQLVNAILIWKCHKKRVLWSPLSREYLDIFEHHQELVCDLRDLESLKSSSIKNIIWTLITSKKWRKSSSKTNMLALKRKQGVTASLIIKNLEETVMVWKNH